MGKELSNDSRLKLVLSDVMNNKVYTINPEESVLAAAKKMVKHKVGGIAVSDSDNKTNPIGMITERDIVTRVVAKGKDSSKMKVKDVASKPLISAKPSMTVTEAMQLMAKKNIRRLVIVENNICKGFVTYRDLLRIAPSVLEIAMEYERIGFGAKNSEDEIIDYVEEDYDADSELEQKGLTVGFYCNQCGEWCDDEPLYDSDDEMVCKDCYEE